MRVLDIFYLPFRKSKKIKKNDSVSFNSFQNESFSDRFPDSKESSMNNDSNSSLNSSSIMGERFVRFRQKTIKKELLHPSLCTVLLVIISSVLLIVFPIIYLLNCFDVTYERLSYDYNRYEQVDTSKPPEKVTTIRVPPKYPQLPIPPKPDNAHCKILEDSEKFDCYPDDGANSETCEARGCCWSPTKSQMPTTSNVGVPLNVPYCFYPNNYNTYKYINISETHFGLEAFLKRDYQSGYPDDVEILKMVVQYDSETRLHIKVLDPKTPRFESPYPEVPIVDIASLNRSYIFELNPVTPGFRIIRKTDNTTIFDANNFLNLIYSNQFLQISSKLPSQYIYGIGEHRSNFLLSTNWSQYTLFNHDTIPTVNGMRKLIAYQKIVQSIFFGPDTFCRTSKCHLITELRSEKASYWPIGGVLDLYFFLGPSPADVVNQYTDLVGKPFMPPYWGLGFHLCRFGYKTLNRTKEVMQRNIDAGIPLDTQWNDLDYMNDSNDFTYDKENFKDLPAFVKDLHSRGMHYIPLIDPGVSASEPSGTYPPYDIGIKMDIFVKNSSGQPFIGKDVKKVWNRASTVWPDFTHPTTVDYWTQMLNSLHEQIEFDGAWIDMNEPSNFLSGSFDGCPNSTLDQPPYLPKIDGGVINYKTMCMSARQFAGRHYDVHNLYGLSEAIATNFALASIRAKRPMIISRSTFAGHGNFAGHWSGDVWSAWEDMRYTVPEMLSFSLFGIPLMGADICGFNGNTTEPLCNRWMQLGAFYPFSRNHNTDDGIDQDPVAFGKQVVASSKKALTIRYYLLPYLYTLFHKAHVNGETVARPLFFEFLEDTKTYNIDRQFLWGPALMINPVLEENEENVTVYVPNGKWYDFYTKSGFYSPGRNFVLPAPLDTIPLLIRGGYVLPCQAPNQTTTESRKSKIELWIAPDQNGNASGEFYWDDGDSLKWLKLINFTISDSYEEKKYSLISFEMGNAVLRSEVLFASNEMPPNLGSIIILGIENSVTKVTVNGDAYKSFQYDTMNKFLVIDELDMDLKKSFLINWK
ncbi:unnamed protein product [Phaedon cochleariae]|uniref:P-type domain-containing protein n=1 Tax=Phaedon cochleariae TaxID=80249 RepID=A0A9N9X6B9_PHACE|nr:unnamed protein product [Phaedon cochleariae]